MEPYGKIENVYRLHAGTHVRSTTFTSMELYDLRDSAWVCTEKLDGTNIRVIFEDGGVRFEGRNAKSQIPGGLLLHLQEHFRPQVEDVAERFSRGLTLYGEGIGPKIQGNKYGNINHDFVVFDVKIGSLWLTKWDSHQVANSLKTEHAHVYPTMSLLDAIRKVVQGVDSIRADILSEGLMATPASGLLNRHGQRIITKIKTRDLYKGDLDHGY